MRSTALAKSRKGAALVTWNQFIELTDDDRRELIDGVLEETEVPTKKHEWIVSQLIMALGLWARRHGGTVLASGYKVRIDRHRGVMPDVQYIRKGRGKLAAEKGMEAAAPDLVVEVISPSTAGYDRTKKLAWYARIGVPEYWVVDARTDTLERLSLAKDGHYRMVEIREGREVFKPSAFPGLRIALRTL